MSEFPGLAKVLGKHTQMCGGFLWSCECGVDWDDNRDITHAEHQADVWREACTIRTVEQLDALPVNPLGCEGVVVKDASGAICERDDDGTWTRDGDTLTPSPRLSLPALLIWHPDWARR